MNTIPILLKDEFRHAKSRWREVKKRQAKAYQFKALLQRDGWMSPAVVEVDDRGIIREISGGAGLSEAPVEAVNGYAVPGFQSAYYGIGGFGHYGQQLFIFQHLFFYSNGSPDNIPDLIHNVVT